VTTRDEAPERRQGFGLERIVNFSDAVMAIAITLLALEIRLPDLESTTQLGPALLALWPRYLSFALSFAVIGMYWIAHHSMFLYIQRFDRPLLYMNLLFLAWIAFMPFPTAVVGAHGFTPLAQVFYAGSVAAMGLVRVVMWHHASYRQRLLIPGTEPGDYRYLTIRGYVGPSVFLLSIPFAFVHFAIPIAMWLASLLSAFARPPGKAACCILRAPGFRLRRKR
jgi:uncharacterized membrane protein